MPQALTARPATAAGFADRWRREAAGMGELIPLPVREPFAGAPALVCAAQMPVTFAEVWAGARDCFADALVLLSMGAEMLWLYFRFWLAALRRDIERGGARAGRSLSFAWGCGAMGWGAFLTLTTIQLIWR